MGAEAGVIVNLRIARIRRLVVVTVMLDEPPMTQGRISAVGVLRRAMHFQVVNSIVSYDLAAQADSQTSEAHHSDSPWPSQDFRVRRQVKCLAESPIVLQPQRQIARPVRGAQGPVPVL